MADRVGLHHPKEINAVAGLTGQPAVIEAKGENPALANLPADLFDLLGLPDPPGTKNASPAATGTGVSGDHEAGELRGEEYHEADDFLALPISPLDAPIAVTHFADAGAKRQTRATTTLRQLATRIEAERAPAKGDLPWLKLATFGDVTTVKGSLRHEANLVQVTGIEGDYDAGEVTPADAVARLKAADLAAIVYTTPTHTPEAPRWRVLCPTSSPMAPAERDALCDRLNAALGGILARESFTRSQAYYFGAVGEGRDHRVHLVDGRPIDRATELRKPAAPEPVSEPDDDDVDLESLLRPDFERIREALAFIPADDRDEWLQVGQALHADSSASEGGFDVWTEWSRTSEKFNAKDQRRVWESFGRRPGKRVTIASLYHLAKAHGWGAKPKVEPTRLTLLSPSDCEVAPNRGYVVKGLIAPGDVGCIFGPPGAGKSIIAPHIGYRVAQGAEAFGMRTKPGEVFYVAAEDPHGMKARVRALKVRYDDAPGFSLVEGVSDLLSDDSADLAALAELVEARRPAIVFIDTLAMAFPGLEENNALEMGKVVAVARTLARGGAAVVLIHHDTKAEGSTPRGHSVLNGALDMAMHVTRDEFGIVRGKLTKNRNGTCDRDVAFTIDPVTLGIDEDGDPITAPTVKELDPGLAAVPEKLTPEKVALRILDRMSDGSGPSPGWVREAEWRAACEGDRGVSSSENPDNRRRQVDRILQRLASAQQIDCKDGMIRRANWTGDGIDGAGEVES